MELTIYEFFKKLLYQRIKTKYTNRNSLFILYIYIALNLLSRYSISSTSEDSSQPTPTSFLTILISISIDQGFVCLSVCFVRGRIVGDVCVWRLARIHCLLNENMNEQIQFLENTFKFWTVVLWKYWLNAEKLYENFF